MLRQRYRLVASVLYIVLGTIIVFRSVLAHVLPLVLLGVVFIALGAVQVLAYLSWRHTTRGQ